MAGGRPPKFKTAKEMQTKIDEYFENCYVEVGDRREFRPTMSGLALALGLSRQGLLNYAKSEKFFDTVKAARQIVEQTLEQSLYGNAVTGAIFNLKNNFGWKDKQEVENTGSQVVLLKSDDGL